MSTGFFRRVLLHEITANATNSTGTGLSGVSHAKQVVVFTDITLGSGTSPTLNVLVDTKLDGTSWINLARFAVFTGNSVESAAIVMNKETVTASEMPLMEIDAGAGTIRNIPWGDEFRIRTTSGGTTPSFTARFRINLLS